MAKQQPPLQFPLGIARTNKMLVKYEIVKIKIILRNKFSNFQMLLRLLNNNTMKYKLS